MKKIILSLGVMALFSITANSQSLVNAGFETWKTDTNEFGMPVEEPEGWYTGNLGISSPDAVTKSTDAHGGTSSARLIPVTFFGSQMPGLLFYEAANTQKLKYLNGYVKTNATIKDTFLISIEYYNSTTQETEDVIQLTSTARSAWTPFNIPISLSSGFSPDSMYITILVMGSSGVYGMLDDLSFSDTPIGSAFGTPVTNSVVQRTKLGSLNDKLTPNPVNNIANLSFTLVKPSPVQISISDITGKEIKKLSFSETLNGLQNIEITTDEFVSGMYFYTIQTAQGSVSKRFSVLK
jgi:hypothetical protein